MGRHAREDEILRKRGRRAQKRLDVALSKQFHPRFLEDADTRLHVVRLLRKRVERMMTEAGGHESYQREILCKRAVFIATMLETLEVEALEGKPLDTGSYTQMSNNLQGVLAKLGLAKRMRSANGLQAHVAEKYGKQ